MEPYIILNFPDLVKQTQAIFWHHIFPHVTLPLSPIKKIGSGSLWVTDEEKFNPINQIRKHYPFLSNNIVTFNMTAGMTSILHIDGHPGHRQGQRSSSINIPITGCNETGVTEFFDLPEEDFYVDSKFNTRVVKPTVPIPEPSAKYCLIDKPIIIRCQVPHRVNNSQNSVGRISVSWSVEENWSIEDVAKFSVDQ